MAKKAKAEPGGGVDVTLSAGLKIGGQWHYPRDVVTLDPRAAADVTVLRQGRAATAQEIAEARRAGRYNRSDVTARD